MLDLWLITVAMLAVTLGVILYVMFAVQRTRSSNRATQNVMLAKTRLQELEQDKKNGLLDDAAYQEARQDIERALLQDVTGEEDTDKAVKAQVLSRSTLFIGSGIAFLLPVVTVTLYLLLGTPDALQDNSIQQAVNTPVQQTEQHDQKEMQAMITKLARRMEKDPNNAEGWDLLARSYMSLHMYPQAVSALQKLHALVGDKVDLLIRLADATAMANDARFDGKATSLINKALAMDPNHPTGLWLAGMAAQEKQQWQKAIDYWQRAKKVLGNNPQSQAELDRLIKHGQSALGTGSKTAPEQQAVSNNKAAASQGITVNVALDEKFKKTLDKNTTVFILAQAMQGPPMPLAVVKKRVADLPLTITLSDSMAMMPTHKISNFQQVRVIARVSKSGTPKAQPGDVQGKKEAVKVNSTIKLVINEQL